MRFLADMGISPDTVRWLRESGHDAEHLRERGLHRLPDADVLRKAVEEQRILLTADLDFGYLLATSGGALPSIMLFRLSDMRPHNVAERLSAALQRFEEELGRGVIVVVTDMRIRARRLPIGQDVE